MGSACEERVVCGGGCLCGQTLEATCVGFRVSVTRTVVVWDHEERAAVCVL